MSDFKPPAPAHNFAPPHHHPTYSYPPPPPPPQFYPPYNPYFSHYGAPVYGAGGIWSRWNLPWWAVCLMFGVICFFSLWYIAPKMLCTENADGDKTLNFRLTAVVSFALLTGLFFVPLVSFWVLPRMRSNLLPGQGMF